MNKSESLKNIFAALAKFQGKVNNPKNTEKNDFFKSKYAPLDVILNAVRPILSENELSIFQNVSGNGETVSVVTILTHSSGEYIESDTLTLNNGQNKGVNESQATGISITYARRYQLSAMLGIASEDDTDGNMPGDRNKNTRPNDIPKDTPKTDYKKPIDTQQKNTAASDNNPAPPLIVPPEPEAPKPMIKMQGKDIRKYAEEIGLSNDDLINILKEKYNKDSFKVVTYDEAERYIAMLKEMTEVSMDEADMPDILKDENLYSEDMGE